MRASKQNIKQTGRKPDSSRQHGRLPEERRLFSSFSVGWEDRTHPKPSEASHSPTQLDHPSPRSCLAARVRLSRPCLVNPALRVPIWGVVRPKKDSNRPLSTSSSASVRPPLFLCSYSISPLLLRPSAEPQQTALYDEDMIYVRTQGQTEVEIEEKFQCKGNTTQTHVDLPIDGGKIHRGLCH